MKISLKFLITLCLSVFIFSSCEKEITIKLPEEPKKLVVEGWIEQNQFAEVILTKSSPYFDPIDSAALLGSIVQGATIYVSDGITTEKLSPTIDPLRFPFLVYKGDSLKGEIGKTYTLKIIAEGNTYTSTTTIEKTAKFDTLWFALNPGKDSIGNVYGNATDDGSVYNYYRAYTKIMHVDQDFVPIFGSVWDDKFFNGQNLTAQLYHGMASNITASTTDNKRGLGYLLGDTVITKLCTMDQASYNFWSAAESEIFSGGNPFSSITSIPSNIVGGALGSWTGYGATYDTIICK
ncbi:MAG: DUF4249 domain-containing protein [Bacteroidota bacterium]